MHSYFCKFRGAIITVDEIGVEMICLWFCEDTDIEVAEEGATISTLVALDNTPDWGPELDEGLYELSGDINILGEMRLDDRPLVLLYHYIKHETNAHIGSNCLHTNDLLATDLFFRTNWRYYTSGKP